MKYLPFFALLLGVGPALAQEVRIATFNVALSRDAAGALAQDIASATNPQMQQIAQILAQTAPDVVVITEFDNAPQNAAAFNSIYLAGQFAHVFAAPVNAGVPSGMDLSQNGLLVTQPGSRQYAVDAYGYGHFPGQYGMVVYSKYPILSDEARSFQLFKWADMPGARQPRNPDGTPYYPAHVWAEMRLSSKSHWDVPVQIGGEVVHLLVSHPTPPVFDGPEDKNGTRNADEIRFWADYIAGAAYMTDDQGRQGGLAPGAHFVIAGDLNADPFDGDSTESAIQQLLRAPQVNTALVPASEGAVEASARQGGANTAHIGPAAQDTADWNDSEGPGNLRVDYVLPSKTLEITGGGVFWPLADTPEAALIAASDHRLVWVDLRLGGAP